jgi:hypothetical protein
MDEETTPEEQAKIMAVCYLDGVGEEWQRVAVEIFNASLRIARSNGAKYESTDFLDAGDMEYFKRLNPGEQKTEPEVDWAAVESSLKGLAGF